MLVKWAPEFNALGPTQDGCRYAVHITLFLEAQVVKWIQMIIHSSHDISFGVTGTPIICSMARQSK